MKINDSLESNVIPLVTIDSGKKFVTHRGFRAIKDGIKAGLTVDNKLAKPSWLRVKPINNSRYEAVKRAVRTNDLATVCEEAKCPNVGECWAAGTATIMLMGDVCTRACKFCAVDTGNPRGWLDPNEPDKAAKAVQLMKLGYVVLTSVNRDDLSDGGASHYASCVKAVKERNPATFVEALVPDFLGIKSDVNTVVDSGLDVFAQNIETVERLTDLIRDSRASYTQTINVLKYAKQRNPRIVTKTSLILGLGESDEEILTTMQDLIATKVDILTLGQYLQPTKYHYPVSRYIPPEKFSQYREWGLEKGFREVVSGPLVRSSYRAEQALSRKNIDL